MAGITVRRMVRPALIALTLAATISSVVSCGASKGRNDSTPHCAILPDSIGLYVGNPVTQMGYQIGKVTSIDPSPTQVKVSFDVEGGRPLPRDVKAIIRSASVLADRTMELVGNFEQGERLESGSCIPLEHSFSPQTISEVVGSAYKFINSINPDGSTNIGDTVRGVDRLARNNGAGINQLLTRTSEMLDSPDQSISNIGSIVRNAAELTTTLVELREPLKEILEDSPVAIDGAATAVIGTTGLAGPGGGNGTLGPLAELVAILESRLGEPTQILLDHTSATIRKVTPHINALSDLFTVVPWWINTIANHFNRRDFHTFNLAYRPPLYRIPTHNGLALCGMMNASLPGSCADVNGQPFAVDVALLQYVLTEAAKQ